MKKLKYYVFILLSLFWFTDVFAIQNLAPFGDLTFDTNGNFVDHTYSGNFSLGYNIYQNEFNNFYFYATPAQNTSFVSNDLGGAIVQCGMSFVKGDYYAVSFYFLSDSMAYYFHPSYSKVSTKLAIGTNRNLLAPMFTYDTVSDPGQFKLVDGVGYVQYYTMIFKANSNGTCLLNTFSATPTAPSSAISFIGYTYESLGSKAPSVDDIQNSLGGQFNNINSSINNSTSQIQGSINNSTSQIQGSINSGNQDIKDSINSGNQAINDNIDEMKQKQDEQNETSKGIWGSLVDGISSIGNWFADLGKSFADGFKNVIDSTLKGLEDLGKGIGESFTAIGNFLGDVFSQVGDLIINGLSSLGNLLLDGLTALGDFVGSIFTQVGDTLLNGLTTLGDLIGGFFGDMWNNIRSLFVGESETTCVSIPNFFNGYDSRYHDIFGSYSDIDVKPDTENGWITQRVNTNMIFLSQPMPPLKPSTTYTLILETGDITGSGASNVLFDFANDNQRPSQLSRASGRISANSRYVWKLTSASDFTNIPYFYSVKFSTSDATITYRIMIIEGEFDDVEYFFGIKDFCETKTTNGLFGMITSLTNSIGNWFKELLSGILEGIKSLFVPTDDQLYEIIDDSSKLTENFGFVGESVDFFLKIFTSLLGLVNANGCVELPEFSIGETSLFPAHKFWDKQNVCLNDNAILSSNITTIRTITSIVIVCMFINFAASKFFSILSKNDFTNDGESVSYGYDMDSGSMTETRTIRSGSKRYSYRSKY